MSDLTPPAQPDPEPQPITPPVATTVPQPPQPAPASPVTNPHHGHNSTGKTVLIAVIVSAVVAVVVGSLVGGLAGALAGSNPHRNNWNGPVCQPYQSNGNSRAMCAPNYGGNMMGDNGNNMMGGQDDKFSQNVPNTRPGRPVPNQSNAPQLSDRQQQQLNDELDKLQKMFENNQSGTPSTAPAPAVPSVQ